ncbi:protein of unknown function [Methylocaldum szegediense]|uniref:Uncharacterized protein n=1 Tax=Methylocaldum szegediense TaxID=73780 RepID=A0ABM9HWH3_9GAMM|nr:protein of unknown function [Methylocaldum szegediense]
MAKFKLLPLPSVGTVFLGMGGSDGYSGVGFGVRIAPRKAGYAELTCSIELLARGLYYVLSWLLAFG